jgi:hypothetical protein
MIFIDVYIQFRIKTRIGIPRGSGKTFRIPQPCFLVFLYGNEHEEESNFTYERFQNAVHIVEASYDGAKND